MSWTLYPDEGQPNGDQNGVWHQTSPAIKLGQIRGVWKGVYWLKTSARRSMYTNPTSKYAPPPSTKARVQTLLTPRAIRVATKQNATIMGTEAKWLITKDAVDPQDPSCGRN